MTHWTHRTYGRMSLIASAIAAAGAVSCANAQTGHSLAPEPATSPTPSPTPGLDVAFDFFKGSAHDDAVPTPESILGFEIGARAATHAQIQRCLREWDAASDRTKLFEYARTFEDRPLYYMVISSPANIRRLDAIKADLQKLADPGSVSKAEGDRLAAALPAVAWMAYSIHGDETSGADAAIATIYQLASSTDASVTSMLDELVVIIDPMMNPDGRDRFLKQVREHRGDVPNVDSQSLLHTGYWPWGRTNHYLFDLNRDWILGVNPESRGRIAAVRDWKPLMLVDAHEMGPLDTYLFSPSRTPINPRLPKARLRWWDVFARDQADAFDRHGWPYYTGEWNEEWYPGYSSSWAGFRGAVGILYEQAGIAEDAVARPEGTKLTYREAVFHQYVSTLTNLATLQKHRRKMLTEFLDEKRRSVDPRGRFAGRTFAITPGANRSRLRRFVNLMKLEGFDVYTATKPFTAKSATDRLGETSQDLKLPAGTVLLPGNQPEAPLLAAMLDFDQRMTPEFLQTERRELLRFGRSKLYDVTAWSLPMLHDVQAYTLDSPMPRSVEPADEIETPDEPLAGAGVNNHSEATAWVIEGADDDSVTAAAHLVEQGVQVRVADKAFTFDDQDFPRGSVVITRNDNQVFQGDFAQVVADVCADLGLQAIGVRSGLGEGNEVPDIGGGHFILLETPRIAIVGRGATSSAGFGEAWFTLDHRLGVRSAQISGDNLRGVDLRRYNVLIIPASFGGSPITHMTDDVKAWVEQGGTLIAIGGSASQLAADDSKLSDVRLLRNSLDDLDSYELAVFREWKGRRAVVDPDAVWSRSPMNVNFPWTSNSDRIDTDEATKRDEWRRIFMPQGAILAARVDDRNWLTFGLGDYVPVLFSGANVLMSKAGVETPVRFGVWKDAANEQANDTKANANDAADDGDGDDKTPSTAGWSTPPPGQKLLLRMSGLLWPEAAGRIANSAAVTRESLGSGQVILFAADPIFRGSTMGTGRIFINAAIYGPGLGASHAIRP